MGGWVTAKQTDGSDAGKACEASQMPSLAIRCMFVHEISPDNYLAILMREVWSLKDALRLGMSLSPLSRLPISAQLGNDRFQDFLSAHISDV